MVWFKIDDGATDHPKTTAAGDEAFGVWCRMGSHAGKYLTNGFIDDTSALRIAKKQKVLDRLVAVGFLDRVTGGYQIHDFLDYNPSSLDVAAKKAGRSEQKAAAGRIGGQRSGETRRQKAHHDQPADVEADEAESKQPASKQTKQNEAHEGEAKRSPVPSRPVPKGRSLDPTHGLSPSQDLTGYEAPQRERPNATNDAGPSVGDLRLVSGGMT